jgi:hypothetical protein
MLSPATLSAGDPFQVLIKGRLQNGLRVSGTKLALVVVPSETVSMGMLDEHARPEHDEI